jgi:hypothetical protein
VVVTEKVAEVWPEATVTVDGTIAAALPLANETTKPEAPAGFPKVTVPVEGEPPKTAVGLKLNPVKAGGLTVRLTIC